MVWSNRWVTDAELLARLSRASFVVEFGNDSHLSHIQ